MNSSQPHTPNHRKTRNRALAAVAVLFVAAVGIAGVIFSKWGGSDAVAAGAQKADQSPASLALAKVRANALAPRAAVKAGHDEHDVPEALNFSSPDDYRLAHHWYEASARTAGRFNNSRTALAVDKSCEGRQELKYASFEDALAIEAGFDVSQATPADILIQDIAQFWRIGPTFYKMSGRWERDQPATYRVNLFSSTSSDFSTDLRVLPLPEGLAPQVDVMTLGDALDREVIQAVGAGGERGARLVHAFYANPKTNETMDVRINNGRPVSWMFGNGRCQRRITGDAYCKCVEEVEHKTASNQKHAANPKTEDLHRVHD